jgi:hypothetical protein
LGVLLPSAPHRWANPGLNGNIRQKIMTIAGKIKEKVSIMDVIDYENGRQLIVFRLEVQTFEPYLSPQNGYDGF